MPVKASSVDLEEQNILFITQKVVAGKVSNYLLVDNSLKEFPGGTKEADGRYCGGGGEHSPEFLNAGNIDWNFHRLGKHFYVMQRLNNFGKIAGNFGQMVLRTTVIFIRKKK